MKKLLLILMLLFTSTSFSQFEDPIYDSEWYESLDEKINFIIFPNPTDSRTIQFRIYRGFEETYNVLITDISGKIVYENILKPEDEMYLDDLMAGVYFVISFDNEGNQIAKKLILK